MENIPVYNARKHGEEELESIHPTIDHLLKETQGVIVYQEQVMQIAQVLSGYSLGEADLLRRAMGKKIKEEMDKQRERFVDGAIKNGVSKPQADTIFDLLAKFANYGFNKSHAAAYAIVSYQTAYMKAHYPVEFLAASMTLDMANTEKLNDFRQDAGRLGIEIVAPSVQTSFRQFETGENRIYYSLAAIKGVGEGAVEHIVQVRGDKPFTSLEDFCLRIDPKQINRRVLESLINAGAFDCFGRDRAELIGGLDRIIGYAQMAQNNRTIGQSDMFGSGGRQWAGKAGSAGFSAMARLGKAAARISGSRFLPDRPSARYLPPDFGEVASAELRRFFGRGKTGRDGRAPRRDRHRQAGAQNPHRQQDGYRHLLGCFRTI